MTKTLKTEQLHSELAGAAFFKPIAEPPAPPPSPTLVQPALGSQTQLESRQQQSPVSQAEPAHELESPDPRPPASPPVRPVVRPSDRPPVRRTITRYAFEFYQDQIETLKRFSLEEKLVGERGSMSEMVREAIDAYVTERLGRAAGPTDARTALRAYARTEDPT